MQITKADIIILAFLITMIVGPPAYFYLLGYR